MKIVYNSPVILTLAIISTALFLLNELLGGTLNSILILHPDFNFMNPFDYLSLISYSLSHANLNHLFGNLSILLLIGPIVEEKYGSKRLLLMMLITVLLTAFLNIILFNNGLLGASGLVFMLIVLASFTNTKNGIPLTFILVLAIYLGNEILQSFKADNISQFAHILGGLSGAFFGFLFKK